MEDYAAIYIYMYISHIVFIQSVINRHLNWFLVFVIVNSAAKEHTCVCVFIVK